MGETDENKKASEARPGTFGIWHDEGSRSNLSLPTGDRLPVTGNQPPVTEKNYLRHMTDFLQDNHPLIIFHAITGGIALLVGLVSLTVKKGSTLHKRAGIVFVYSMLLSAVSAIVVSTLPDHKSSFLLAIGLFSTYLIISGWRSLQFKKRGAKMWDWITSLSMALVGIGMIVVPIVETNDIDIILAVFGAIGLLLASRDITMYGKYKKLRKSWMALHLSKIVGAYIAAVTAFLVVNGLLPGLWAWFTPTVIGSIYITYWNVKLSPRRRKRK